MWKNWKLVFLFTILVLTIFFVNAFQGTSTSYNLDSKIDSATSQNVSSNTFTKRFSSGHPVGNTTSTSFIGRLGLPVDIQTMINFTSHNQSSVNDVIRGSDSVANEDDLGLVNNAINFSGRVVENITFFGVGDANCSFFREGSLVGNSLSNGSGGCNLNNYDKSSLAVGIHIVLINYTLNDSEGLVNQTNFSMNIIRYVAPNARRNTYGGKYINGSYAGILVNITKINSSGTFFYDPLNLTINASNAADNPYSEGEYVSGYRLNKTDTGQYEVRVNTNMTHGTLLKWNIYVSDDHYTNFISSAVHSDTDVANAACGNGVIEPGEQCDGGSSCSASCTTISSSGGGDSGGGGGGAGTPSCTENWVCSEWGYCTNGVQTRDCDDVNSCGSIKNKPIESRSCGEFICSDWSSCTPVDQFSGQLPSLILSFNNNLKNYLKNSLDSGILPLASAFPNSIVSDSSFIPVTKELEEGDKKIYYIHEKTETKSFNILSYLSFLINRVSGSATAGETCSYIGQKDCHSTLKSTYQECVQVVKKGKTQLVWKNSICDRGLICSQGNCVCPVTNSCSSEGIGMCVNSGSYKICQKDSNGCLQWSKGFSCESGLRCLGEGDCQCPVENACEIEGSTRCSATTRFQVCEKNNNGCLQWSSRLSCGFGEVCSDGSCIKGKTGDSKVCNIGEKICLSGSVYECQLKFSKYNEWILSDRCVSGETCSNASCSINHCVNKLKDFDETDVDCGGNDCLSCPIFQAKGNITDVIKNESFFSPQENITRGETITNASNLITDSGNLSIFDIQLGDQIIVSSDRPLRIRINKGDAIAVEFVKDIGNKTVLVKFTKIKTFKTNTDIEEEHTVTIINIGNKKISVTIRSEPVTKEIQEGEIKIFDFSGDNVGVQIRECACPSGDPTACSGEGSSVQYCNLACTELWECTGWRDCIAGKEQRSCFDISNCGSVFNKPPVSRDCRIYSFFLDYSPKELNLVVENGTNIDFKVSVLSDNTNIVIKWFLSSKLVKTDSGLNSLISLFSNNFSLDSDIRAEVSTSVDTQSIQWTVKIVPFTGCKESWNCSWTECTLNDEYSYAYACNDLNKCGTNLLKPYREICGQSSVWECGNWTSCSIAYNLADLIKDEFSAQEGKQERLCMDLKEIRNNKKEVRTCDVGIPIYLEKKNWCEEHYVEIYETESKKLVSRVKETEINKLSRVDISFITSDFVGYCGYCYDGVKNFDETDVDCGGKNCPACKSIRDYFDYIVILKWVLWLLLLLLLLLFLKRKEEKKKKVIGLERKFEITERSIISRIIGLFKRRERRYEVVEIRHRKNIVIRFFEAIGAGLSEFIRRMKVRRARRYEEKGFKARIERIPERRVEIIERKRVNPFAAMLRKLRGWRKREYYEAEKLEGRMKEEAKHFEKGIVSRHKIKNAWRRRKEKWVRQRQIRKIEKERARAEKERLKRARRIEKEKIKASRLRDKQIKKMHKEALKREKRKKKDEQRKIIDRRRKLNVGGLQSDNRLNRMLRKLKEWRSQGYYDAQKLERRVKDDLSKHKKKK